MRQFKFNMTTLKLVSEVSCLCQFNCVLIKAGCWQIEVNPANFHVPYFPFHFMDIKYHALVITTML